MIDHHMHIRYFHIDILIICSICLLAQEHMLMVDCSRDTDNYKYAESHCCSCIICTLLWGGLSLGYLVQGVPK